MERKLSIHISYLLRHHPEAAGLDMDVHGWVQTAQLIDGVNRGGKYSIDTELLRHIVETDSKGRYRFNDDMSKIKACQGHSIPRVMPEMEYTEPPEFLYHGTNTEALKKIEQSGAIKKMSRHAVHMQAEREKAWQSAARWRHPPVILKIAAGRMYAGGFAFGITENSVWCTEEVPTEYIVEKIYALD